MKKEIEFKDILNDVELFLTTHPQLKKQFVTKEYLYRQFVYKCEYFTHERIFRKAIQELICTGRVRCLIASSKGYKFTSDTAEMQRYLKSVHHRAMEILRRMAALKSQAETEMGLQLNFEFYNELYKGQR